MSETAPAISVVLPVHNGMPFLGEALDSLFAQDFTDFEIVLIDDGSTDGTSEYVDGLAVNEPRLRVVRNGRLGLVGALNFGITQARAALIARMDADDRARPERLGLQFEALKAQPGLVAVAGQMAYMDAEGRATGRVSRFPTDTGAVRAALEAGRSEVAHPTVLVRREAVLRAGGYRAAYKAAEDLDLWLRLLAFGEIGIGSEVVLDYRQHPGQVSQTQKLRQWFSTQLAVATHRLRAEGLTDPTDDLDAPVDWHDADTRTAMGPRLAPLLDTFAVIDKALSGELVDVSGALDTLARARAEGLAVSRFRQQALVRLAKGPGSIRKRLRAVRLAIAENPRRAVRQFFSGS